MGIVAQMQKAGVVGCGGAGFPTHRKFQGQIQCFIVNGAECEPLLRTDRYLMRHRAQELVTTVEQLRQELSIPRCVIALKHHYTQETTALRQAIAATNAKVELHLLESFYPAGDEQTIVQEVTGQVVPPGGIPLAVGAVVDNVATVLAMADAIKAIPFTHKYLTITGEVKTPTIVRVPVGTAVAECLALAGGVSCGDFHLISGGPMMGRPISEGELETAVVTKTTSGLLVLPKGGYLERNSQLDIKQMLKRAQSACIQCTACTQLCPRNLLGHPLEPHRIMRKMAMGGTLADLVHDPVVANAALCCECGICQVYACPMGLQPRTINGLLKQELRKAGLGYQAPEDWQPQVHPLRNERKVPTPRLANRAGVYGYDDYTIDTCADYTPGEITLPLQMHIGAPAVPCVQVGDQVQAGDLVACPPEGALGAVVHTGISGVVKAIAPCIVIGKE